VLLELSRRQISSPGGVKASSRELAKSCGIARSNTQKAIDQLTQKCKITARQGTATNSATYRVNIFDTLRMGGPITGPPPGLITGPPLALFQGHPGPVLGPPPTDPKGLAAAAAALDFDPTSLGLIDRVLSAKPKKADPQDLQRFRARLHGYMAKFGRDGNGRAVQFPHPPSDEIVAQFLAIDDPNALDTMLSNLILDAQNAGAHLPNSRTAYNPWNYVWFLTIALSRRHGIDFRSQKQARAILRDVKKRPAPPEPEQLALPDVAALARKKAMK
jgi:hypothetical protein